MRHKDKAVQTITLVLLSDVSALMGLDSESQDVYDELEKLDLKPVEVDNTYYVNLVDSYVLMKAQASRVDNAVVETALVEMSEPDETDETAVVETDDNAVVETVETDDYPYADESWVRVVDVAEQVRISQKTVVKRAKDNYDAKLLKGADNSHLAWHVTKADAAKLLNDIRDDIAPKGWVPFTELDGHEDTKVKSKYLENHGYQMGVYLSRDESPRLVTHTTPAGAAAWSRRYDKPEGYEPVTAYAREHDVDAESLRERLSRHAHKYLAKYATPPSPNTMIYHAPVEIMREAVEIMRGASPKKASASEEAVEPVEVAAPEAPATKLKRSNLSPAPPPPKTLAQLRAESSPAVTQDDTQKTVEIEQRVLTRLVCNDCEQISGVYRRCASCSQQYKASDLGVRYCVSCHAKMDWEQNEPWESFKNRIRCMFCQTAVVS